MINDRIQHAIISTLDAHKDIKTWWVAYSGGPDSTVLLHALHTLLDDFKVIHVDHGIQDQDWAYHCHKTCQSYPIPLITHRLNLGKNTTETQAREARYDAFVTHIAKGDGLLMAHHADDQVETLLQRLERGATLHGLLGIPKHRIHKGIHIIRPFLTIQKKTLLQYIQHHQLNPIDDPSNQDRQHQRSLYRHTLLPLLNQYSQRNWHQALLQVASHCHDASSLLKERALEDLKHCGDDLTLHIPTLTALSPIRQKNLIRHWIRQQDIALPSQKKLASLLEALKHSKKDQKTECQWHAHRIMQHKECLHLIIDPIVQPQKSEHALLDLDENNPYWQVKKKCIPGLDPNIMSKLRVRYRKGGERIQMHIQHKRVKHILQEANTKPWERDMVPLIYLDDQLIMVGSYALSPHHQVSDGFGVQKKEPNDVGSF